MLYLCFGHEKDRFNFDYEFEDLAIFFILLVILMFDLFIVVIEFGS